MVFPPFNLCAFLFLASLFAPTDGLTTVEFKHYVLETDVVPDRAKFIGQLMDATGKEFDRRFAGFHGIVRKKPKLKVFASKERYVEELKGATSGGNVEFTSGVFCVRDETVYSYDSPGLESTLKHECFHQFAHFVIGGTLPLWANEGLAEYFSAGVFDEWAGEMRLGGVPTGRVLVLRDTWKTPDKLTIDELLQIGPLEWQHNLDDPRGAAQYAQAWALCHFLVHGEGGKYEKYFDRFLRFIDGGLDGETAFKQAFGPDTKPLQAKYDAYIEQLVARTPLRKVEKPPPDGAAKPKAKKKP